MAAYAKAPQTITVRPSLTQTHSLTHTHLSRLMLDSDAHSCAQYICIIGNDIDNNESLAMSWHPLPLLCLPHPRPPI